jgi:signal transduction histidine kinase
VLADRDHRVGTPDPRDLVAPFLLIDRIGTAAAAVLVVALNAVLGPEPGVWWVVPVLAGLLGALTWARTSLDAGRLVAALALIAAGHWAAAVAVAVIFPFLWPVMVLTAVIPLVLATPHLDRPRLVGAIVATGAVVAVVAVVGLTNDDGGAVPDLDDDLELVIVTVALVAHLVALALVVWQHHRLQTAALDEAAALNRRLRDSEAALAASRRRVVDAGDRERSRIERDLHDGAQQRLVALRLGLQALAGRADADPELAAGLDTATRELEAALDELRELAHGIYPPVLETGGLGDALAAAARRTPVDVHLAVDGVGRHDRPVETALYFTALEALTNVAKHAPGSTAHVRLELTGGGSVLALEVADDGPGFAAPVGGAGRGLVHLEDRLGAVGGRLTVRSAPGAGTTVRAEVPVPDPPPAG